VRLGAAPASVLAGLTARKPAAVERRWKRSDRQKTIRPSG